jgi:hypothetical protein
MARIKDAIERASFLCGVISDSALASEWVRREIEVGLLREADSYRLTIVPLLLKNVDIPEALKDRFWIDCRCDTEAGLVQLVGLLRRHYAVDDSSGTIEHADYFLYYGSEEGWVEGRYCLALDVVSFDRDERFCLLTEMSFRGNDAARLLPVLRRPAHGGNRRPSDRSRNPARPGAPMGALVADPPAPFVGRSAGANPAAVAGDPPGHCRLSGQAGGP